MDENINKNDDLLKHGEINPDETNLEEKSEELKSKENELSEEQSGLIDEISKLSQDQEASGDTESDELTDEEKREQYIELLKKSKINFQNTVHKGNMTETKFDENYKKKRKKRNKLAKKSRQKNRK